MQRNVEDVLMALDDSPFNQAGEFWGSFVFTLISKTVNKITKRKHTNNEQIVESVHDLGDIIEQIDMFKMMHDFAQDFLTVKLRLLFVGDIKVHKTPADVQKAWQKWYKREYESNISLFKKRILALKGRMQVETNEKKDAVKSSVIGLDIRKPMEVVEEEAPMAAKVAEEFIAEIEKRANEALSGELPPVPEFKDSMELKAHRVLNHADKTLVALISILTHLYSKMTQGINETN